MDVKMSGGMQTQIDIEQVKRLLLIQQKGLISHGEGERITTEILQFIVSILERITSKESMHNEIKSIVEKMDSDTLKKYYDEVPYVAGYMYFKKDEPIEDREKIIAEANKTFMEGKCKAI